MLSWWELLAMEQALETTIQARGEGSRLQTQITCVGHTELPTVVCTV